MGASVLLTLLLALCSLPAPTTAYNFFAQRIPNGRNVPHPCKTNHMWRGVGHLNPLGGGTRNRFGQDFDDNGQRWNRTLCELDSDGDGVTNGQELGDPHCTWTEGQLPNRTSDITHPAICDPWEDHVCQSNNSWVDCDMDTFQCHAFHNEDTRNVTLRFPPTPVPNTYTNHYCMTFDLPGDRPYHMIGIEPVIDNVDVMHHILVFACDGDVEVSFNEPVKCGMQSMSGCTNLIAGWQVGVPGYCVNPIAGFLFGEGTFTRILMEFHWTNPELISDYTDASGVTFFYTPELRPNSAATLLIGQAVLEIPPLMSSVVASGSCSPECTESLINGSLHVLEAGNHMHYLGRSQKVELFRNNELVATLTDDRVYSYDALSIHIHDPPIEILPGDEIRTTCEFSSLSKDTTTYSGEATSDEMCYSLLVVYPQEALTHRRCVAYGQESTCGVDQPSGSEEECDVSSFLSRSNPDTVRLMGNIYLSCEPFSPCTPQCAQLMESLRDEPCLRGEAFEEIKALMMQDSEGMMVLAKLFSCWGKSDQECSTCPSCPEEKGRAGEATTTTSALPGLTAFAVLLVVTLTFN